MKDNTECLDLATPSIAFTVVDLEPTRAALSAAGSRRRTPATTKARRASLRGSRGPLVRGDAASTTTQHRIFATTVASVYPLPPREAGAEGPYAGRARAVIRWLTGFDEAGVERHLAAGTTFEDFFAAARLNPNAGLITAWLRVRVQEIEDP